MKIDVELSKSELERYDRQILLFGVENQKKLKKSSVLIIGLGGLGCPAAIYCTAVGFGHVIVVDREKVELSNLNRQILHWTKDVGKPKVKSAIEKLRELNPEIEIEGYEVELNEENAYDFIKKVDVVLDGLDNWKTRFLVNKVCVELRKPFIHAGIHGMHGQLLTIIPGKTPCLQCIIPKQPPEKRPFPVLGTTPGILALLQVTEAIKIVTGYGEPAIGKIIVYDGYTMTFTEIKVYRRKDCVICGHLQ